MASSGEVTPRQPSFSTCVQIIVVATSAWMLMLAVDFSSYTPMREEADTACPVPLPAGEKACDALRVVAGGQRAMNSFGDHAKSPVMGDGRS